MAMRSFSYGRDQAPDMLLQRLQGLTFGLDEEESLGITDVTVRARSAFDVEKVTKRFYDRFKAERDAFERSVQGIPDDGLRGWYVSITLNRLMFVYFMQKKPFLDNDPGYLRHHLEESAARWPDRFYRHFLCPLFFQGFATRPAHRSPETQTLLGSVPFLDGGLFARHEIEERYGEAICIPDQAFARLFDFFDAYRWHLDERPLRANNEINPDVLGYIFEKYINQKEMGAYYTKEDITGYIARNTLLPHLLDRARELCPAAFEGADSVWRLMREDPDRYIYPAVRHGVQESLPQDIAAGLNPPSLHDPVGEGPVATLAARQGWNRPAPAEYGLPTETWREAVARRQRCDDLRARLRSGEVHEPNDLITLNLDSAQFVQDVVEGAADPTLVAAFWRALQEVRVLDPTCGSGAFLFAALNLLEPLYEACLERMRAFLEEPGRSRFPQADAFRKTLARANDTARHPNRRYYVLKTILLHNLYGVDIMDEAVEICRLRLFLKLVAQVERVEQIEPLPDLDLNIRAGNTLVGFTSLAEVELALGAEPKGNSGNYRLPSAEIDAQLRRVQEEAETVQRAYERFQEMQTEYEMPDADYAASKRALVSRLGRLDDTLNRALARAYGVDPEAAGYAEWLTSHRPFHWLTAFYGVIQRGGFDVIIGNPPYVEYSARRSDYRLTAYDTLSCGNLYAYVIERCLKVLADRQRMGMIVQLPIVCTDRMIPLQDLCRKSTAAIWFATFDDRPGKLFDGLQHIRATILVCQKGNGAGPVYATRYKRWYSEARPQLFEEIQFCDVSPYLIPGAIPKIGDATFASVWRSVSRYSPLARIVGHGAGSSVVYYHNAPQYWVRALHFAPFFRNERAGERASTQVKQVPVNQGRHVQPVIAVLSSSVFYLWFVATSDCRHLNMREIERFPVGLDSASPEITCRLAALAARLTEDLCSHARRKVAAYRTTGTVEYDEFQPALSKPIIDQIDSVLARHYGFTEEQLDYVINYDIKYRLGDALVDAEEET